MFFEGSHDRAPPFGGFPELGVLFGGPYSKDYGVLGVYIGLPYFRETRICL